MPFAFYDSWSLIFILVAGSVHLWCNFLGIKKSLQGWKSNPCRLFSAESVSLEPKPPNILRLNELYFSLNQSGRKKWHPSWCSKSSRYIWSAKIWGNFFVSRREEWIYQEGFYFLKKYLSCKEKGGGVKPPILLKSHPIPINYTHSHNLNYHHYSTSPETFIDAPYYIRASIDLMLGGLEGVVNIMWIHITEVLIHIKISHIYYTYRYNICAIIRLFGLFSLISF